MQKRPLRTERRDNAAGVGRVGEIAPRAARHEDLHARLAVLFEQQRPPAAFGGARRGEEPSRSGADDDDFVRLAHHQLPTLLEISIFTVA